MGSSQSSIIIEDLREVIRDIRKRLASLEEENAIMKKQITNMKVSQNEQALVFGKLNEHVFREKILEQGRSHSVRRPKGSRSLFTN